MPCSCETKNRGIKYFGGNCWKRYPGMPNTPNVNDRGVSEVGSNGTIVGSPQLKGLLKSSWTMTCVRQPK